MTGHLRRWPGVRRNVIPRATMGTHMTSTLSLLLTDAQVRSLTTICLFGVTGATFAFLAYLILLN